MRIKVDYSAVMNYIAKLSKAEEITTPAISVGLNEVGDGLITVLASNIARETGLGVEEVRGLMQVKRATKNDLNYDITVDGRLLEDDPRTLEGKRESRDFGKQRPETLVIIVNVKDDLVCMDCEELAAAGPMPIEIAREHIPKHPHCRCTIMPYVPKGRRMPVQMTSLTGTRESRRSGGKANREMTLRQMAQEILDKMATTIRIQLK
jgi:hypothetical protein